MKRILFVVAAAVATFVSVGATMSEAHVTKSIGHAHRSIHVNVRVGHLGCDYRGFRSTCYLPAYRANLVYDPVTRQWYFYSPILRQFVPVALISQYSPLTGGIGGLPPGVGPVATPGLPVSGTPTLPPGAVPAPPAPPANP